MEVLKEGFIPVRAVSLNAYKDAAFWRRKKNGRLVKLNPTYSNYKKKLKEALDSCIGNSPYDPNFKVRLEVVSLKNGRKYDKDNIYGGLKPFVDLLVKSKWIKDDTEKWLDLEVTQETVKKSDTQGISFKIYKV